MRSHLSHLAHHFPGFLGMRILDVGAGRGAFLVEVARQGGKAVGIEINPAYITAAKEAAQREGVSIEIREGVGEALPFPDASFEVVHLAEVIEHVQDPRRVLEEVYRVLVPGGGVYISVPNRFGLRDQHFHLFFVNWLPRAWSDGFIRACGAHKEYDDLSAGHQRLSEMHYYTLSQFLHLCQSVGFSARDLRLSRIAQLSNPFVRNVVGALYPVARAFYFDSFHLLLTKPQRFGEKKNV